MERLAQLEAAKAAAAAQAAAEAEAARRAEEEARWRAEEEARWRAQEARREAEEEERRQAEEAAAHQAAVAAAWEARRLAELEVAAEAARRAEVERQAAAATHALTMQAIANANAAAQNGQVSPYFAGDSLGTPAKASANDAVTGGNAEDSDWDSDGGEVAIKELPQFGHAERIVPVPDCGQAEYTVPSGWDSDDEELKGLTQPQSGHQATSVQQQQPAAQPVLEAAMEEDNPWDDSAPMPPSAAPAPPRAAAYDACGAPVRTAQDFSPGPAPDPAGFGDDLDDLVGEVMSVSTTTMGPGIVQNFHCTGCDFQVLRCEGYVWTGDVEYMFFRNNYPAFEKLRRRLARQDGCTAYCCQCSWKSAHTTTPLADVAEGLRWRVLS